MTPAPSQQTILAGLRSFLLYVLPPGVEVILGQINRVPEPQGSEFVVMTPWNDIRLATTIDGEADVRFVGSIAGAVLTVASVNFGVITAGALLFGVGVLPGTVVGAQLTGAAGSVGTYTVAPSQTLASGTVLSCGAMTLMQELQMDIRLDFHSCGNNGADMARTFTTPSGPGYRRFMPTRLGRRHLLTRNSRSNGIGRSTLCCRLTSWYRCHSSTPTRST